MGNIHKIWNAIQIWILQEYKIFHLAVVCVMIALVLSSRYSKTIARFTMKDSTTSAKSGGLQLYITLTVALYFLIPLCHWMWLYGGLKNQLVLVNNILLNLHIWISAIFTLMIIQFYGNYLFFGLQKKIQEVIVPWAFGAFGFIFYLTRYPEKLWRKSGFFDIFGASHQVSTISKPIGN